MVTVISVPEPGVALFERIQLMVPPAPPDILALNATVPPTHNVTGVGELIVAHVGLETTGTLAAAEVTGSHPVPLEDTTHLYQRLAKVPVIPETIKVAVDSPV